MQQVFTEVELMLLEFAAHEVPAVHVVPKMLTTGMLLLLTVDTKRHKYV